MRLRNVLLGFLAIGVATPAVLDGDCFQFGNSDPPTGDSNEGGINILNPFNPWILPDSLSTAIISGGHETEYRFRFPGPFSDIRFVDVYRDGRYQGSVDKTQAKNAIDSACGPGFGRRSASSPAKENSRLALSAQSLPAGQTNLQVVTGDFNGDGIADSAAVTGRGIFVTLRDVDGTALSSTLFPIPADTGPSIVAVDFNGDGKLDLAITQGVSATQAMPSPPGNVVVLLGNGDGTFGAPKSFPVGTVGSSSYLATGDFNGDGLADLAVTNFTFPQPNTIAVLIGKGDGSFAPAATYPGGGASLVAADFNGDGKLDPASLGSNLSVLLGRGDGTFQAPVSSVWGKTFGLLGYADLNHDGKLDLLIADHDASSMVEMLGNGDGTFQARKEYLVSAEPNSIAILPLDDGNTLIFTADNASNNTFFVPVAADGTVHGPELQTLGSGPAAVAAADLNGDHNPDLVITDAAADKIYVKLASGKGLFGSPVTYSIGAGSQPGALIIADLNGDGKPDVITADTTGLDVLLGKGDGTLGPVTLVPAGGALASLAVSDFNSDGKPDVAAVNAQGGGVTLFPGNGNGTFGATRRIPLANALALVSGDINGDGKADLIVASGLADFQTSGNLAVLLGNGDGTFQAARNIALPAPLWPQPAGSVQSTALAVADLNGDGKLDVIAVLLTKTGTSQSQIAVLLGNGDGTFRAPILTNTRTAPPVIAVADLNGDGKPDLLLADCCGLSEASFLLGNGDGTFQAEVQFPSGPDPQGLAVADFNGDGKPDVAIIGRVRSADRGTLAILFNAFRAAASGAQATVTVVSAANPASSAIAPGSLAIAYGKDLAQGTPGATSLPLPTTFGGTTVTLVDSAGKSWPAPLVYVLATQVNFAVPSGVATGPAQLTVTSGDGTQSTATVPIAAVAPGLFTLNSANLAAASVLRLSADGTQTPQQVYTVNSAGAVVANPIDLGSASDQVYLTLFGTGLQAARTSGVGVSIAGIDVPVQFAGAQGSFAGLDQVNVILPHSLAGKGSVTLQLTAAGVAANPVQLTIQ